MSILTDTTANNLTIVSGSSAVISFAVQWQPLVALVVGLIGCVSGAMAIVYYYKKLRE